MSRSEYMKKLDKKGFTLIELIVVIAVVGILVLLAMPRFIGYTQRAELSRIQHDVKVMEQEIGTVLINNDDDFNNWENNSKDFNQLIQENRLFEKEGVVKEVESIDNTYKIIPERYKGNINTKLKGTFYANNNGKVYYEHGKSIGSTEPGEKEPGYSDEEIQDLIKEGVIPVATADELNNVRNATIETYGEGTKWEGLYEGGLDKQYIQVADIDLSEYSEEGWTPIGTLPASATFTGIYDGGNYVITGLEVKGEDRSHQGLFGRTDGATIYNVGLEDIRVTGSTQVGGLVGEAWNSIIENSYVTGSVTGSVDRVGGLVGYARSSTIDNSYATGSVDGSGNVGGLVGMANNGTTIKNSYSAGSVKGGNRAGGLVGEAGSGVISNSYATGEVTGGNRVGGFVGLADSSTISNSHATGSVEGTSYVGGFVGQAQSSTTISNSYSTGSVDGSGNQVGGLVGRASSSTISNSYTTGSVDGSRNQVGGFVGQAQSSTIENSYATGLVKGSIGSIEVGGLVGFANWDTTISNSYWDTETTGQSTSSKGTRRTTEEMQQQATYPSSWDFVNVWKIDEGNDYPKLR